MRAKANVRQPDGSYKRMDVYAKTARELGEKIKLKENKAEEEYRKSLNPPFSDIAERWFEQHQKEIAEYTSDCYIAPLKDVTAAFGQYMLSEITPLMIQQFLDKMVARGYARQTVKLRLIVINMVYQYAMLYGFATSSPTAAVKVSKKAKTTKRLLPEQWEIEKALEPSSLALPLGLYLPFLYYTGCRKCEALALSVDDIDTKNDLIHINKKIIYVNNRPVLQDGSKTENGIRSIPLLNPIKKLLKDKKGILFAAPDGGYLHKSNFDKMFSKYRKETGINSTGHQFRHAFATLCYDADLDEKDMADIVGHASSETTKKIYVHIREQRRKAFTDKLNQVV